MFRKLLFATFVFTISNGNENEFRFDYKYSEDADGWLKLHRVPATFRDAKIRCKAEGGVLASPLTDQLRYAILQHVQHERGTVPNSIFTGIHATFSQGDYGSIEGVPLDKLPITWSPGEPDNYQNSENCLTMLTQTDGTISDVRCNDVFPYVCYKKKTHDLIITECGTHDTAYSMDERTGSCYKFHRHGVPWHLAYSICVAEGAHLVIINSATEAEVIKEIYKKIPQHTIFAKYEYASVGLIDNNDGVYWMTIHEYSLDSRTGKCYKFHRHGMSWPRAYQTCIAEGAHLAIINSDEESQVLVELFQKHPDNVIFSDHKIYAALGFVDLNDGGSWITVHGETLYESGFERWEAGEPNNASQPVGELCGCIYKNNGNFYDYPCNWALAFICEKTPKTLQDSINK